MNGLAQIGKEVAALRRSRELSQQALARAAGVSRATVDLLENGRATELGFVRLQRILAVLGLELRLLPAATARPTLDELLREDADDPGLDR